MLTEKMKQIAWDAYIDEDGDTHEQVYAAVEAVLAEQAGAAEQWQNCNNSSKLSQINVPQCTAPTQPPAGDAQTLQRMKVAYNAEYDKRPHIDAFTIAMAAALAAAREGMVSRDSMKDLMNERDAQWMKEIEEVVNGYAGGLDENDGATIAALVRNRLAKPAEQEMKDRHIVEVSQNHPGTQPQPEPWFHGKCSCGSTWLTYKTPVHQCPVAALKAGKHD